MTAGTGAVENAPEKYSVFCICRYFELGVRRGGPDLRRIRRDLSGHSELDRLCFFVDSFELEMEISLAQSRDGLRRLGRTPASFGQSLYAFVSLVTP